MCRGINQKVRKIAQRPVPLRNGALCGGSYGLEAAVHPVWKQKAVVEVVAR